MFVLVHVTTPYDGKTDVEEFINRGIVDLADNELLPDVANMFRQTFRLLNESFAGDSLRRFTGGLPRGKVSLAAFEVVAVGVGVNIAGILQRHDPVGYVRQRIVDLWARDESDQFFSAGMRGTTRIQRTVPAGADWFAHG